MIVIDSYQGILPSPSPSTRRVVDRKGEGIFGNPVVCYRELQI
ncbi:MAG: hypothetical protein DDT19_00536 [Syntrophomonadaceae bacterium]|nr:hypothetical protein [Bacillota bacterium]